MIEPLIIPSGVCRSCGGKLPFADMRVCRDCRDTHEYAIRRATIDMAPVGMGPPQPFRAITKREIDKK